ncbi:WD40/YVTN/BNR-like repeat-containing protein [Pseudomonas monteilii]|uniref:Glycosyl hydrolase n=1 Tax=Pseudomonas monteilii TaxID=76759 RepID=A0A399MA35_9PSED|nr:YCF48-related protein [Pseudomonas monteilii]RII78255.1 glycosyl hydrolase [Pseudomonas monteilii]
MKTIQRLMFLTGVLALAPLVSVVQAEPGVTAAVQSAIASEAMMLGVARAESRIVAVGDHGVVLLSDDQGASFRQAHSVPVSSPLNAVSFAGAKKGWAVGQGGAILVTEDGGENWQLQRFSTEEDRPLFAVHFFNEREGVAVGLWSLVLITRDGGQTWVEQPLQPVEGEKRADLNLLSLFPDAQGGIYATAERGKVLRSQDKGITWEYLDTGYSGTLWTGAVLPDGSLLVGGQRGTLMLSRDGGHAWRHVALPATNSITGVDVSGEVIDVVGLDGFTASSHDGGQSFVAAPREDGTSLTAVIRTDGGALLFSKRGVIRAEDRRVAMQGNE